MKANTASPSSPQACSEVVIYRLKPECEVLFNEVHQRILAEMRTWKGLLSVELNVSCDDPLIRMDRLLWQDESSARHAHEQYRVLKEAATMMDTVESVLFSGHFFPELMGV